MSVIVSVFMTVFASVIVSFPLLFPESLVLWMQIGVMQCLLNLKKWN